MMTQAFYTGVSGIKTNATAINILSDNMSNIDTVGFRGLTAEFSSLFEKSMAEVNNKSSVASTFGLGTKLQATSMMQQTGSLLLSERDTDLAIDGEGWFALKGANDIYYTRAGNFNFDANGSLVSEEGLSVLGSMANNIQSDVLTKVLPYTDLGDIGVQTELKFPKSLAYPPEPTKNVNFYGNIGLEDATRTFQADAIDGENNKNSIILTLSKAVIQTPPGTQWDVKGEVIGSDTSTLYDTQTGVINFDSSGSLISTTLTSLDNNGSKVNINLGSKLTGIISTNSELSSSSSSDGTYGGDLVGYNVQEDGDIVATFTNGKQSSVGKIALFHFQNDQGLYRISGTKYTQSSNSGEPLIYKDANGKNILGSRVMNYKLEGSNVLASTALSELIILQRSYDANAKSITTADQMMQKALNMHK